MDSLTVVCGTPCLLEMPCVPTTACLHDPAADESQQPMVHPSTIHCESIAGLASRSFPHCQGVQGRCRGRKFGLGVFERQVRFGWESLVGRQFRLDRRSYPHVSDPRTSYRQPPISLPRVCASPRHGSSALHYSPSALALTTIPTTTSTTQHHTTPHHTPIALLPRRDHVGCKT
jgi:hypothetical protein